MDKNMIHIDDLFRQRMEDREASPKPGAWSNMRELLDKEMPVAATGTNWRRVFGYFTGLLLLASASVGGYSLYTGQLNSNVGTAPVAVRASNTGIGNSVASSRPARLAAPNKENTAIQGSAGTARLTASSHPGLENVNVNGSATTRANILTTQKRGANNYAGNIVSEANEQGGRASVGTNLSSTQHLRGSASGAAVAYSVTDRQAKKPAPASQSIVTTIKSIAPAPTRQREQIAPAQDLNMSLPEALAANAASGADARKLASAAHARTVQQERRSPEKSAPLALNSSAGSRSQGAKSSKAAEISDLSPIQNGIGMDQPTPMLRVRDTIRRIDIVVRRSFNPGSARSVFRADTLPAELVVVERLVPAPMTAAVPEKKDKPGNRSNRRSEEKQARQEMMASSAKPETGAKSSTIPESALDKASNEANDMANDAAGKLSGAKLGFWKSLRLDERVQSAKTSLQSIELYPGVIGGINATVLTPNALGGFQFGLSALLAINDWWSIQGEAKYFYRFNTGSSLRDDYVSIKDTATTYSTVSGTNYVSRSWSEAKVSHNFNYEAVQTLEVPIMLRYNNNRFFTQFGVNFVSSRPIAAREVTSDPSEYRPVNSGLAPANQPNLVAFPTNTQANIRMADFGNRFGVGYAIGAGYSFTQAVYFDLRLTQTFWDNANTVGARQISKDLLRNPSFQLSLGYRFGMAKQRD